MSSGFLRSIRPVRCQILSQCTFLLAVLWIFQFCKISTLSAYAFDFPLGSVFRGNQTVLSENATFEAGLFSPLGSDLVYLGIWYVGISPRSVIWVANRNKPVSGTASYGCSADGQLQLWNSSGRVIWSSETKGRNVSGGVFKSIGNIMLLGENASTIVWQSFDYPGNVWLPNMKLQPGKKLVSWKSANDPSEGPYSLGMISEWGGFVAKWKDAKQYWASGAWNGHGYSESPYMVNNTFIYYFYNESGFWWSTVLSKFDYIVRVLLDYDGMIKDQNWDPNLPGWNSFWFEPENECVVYGLCGPNGVCRDNISPFCSCPAGFEPADAEEWSSDVWSSGCSLMETLDCREGSGEQFTTLQHTSFDAGWRQSADLDANECLEACLRNCSCAAYSHDGSGKNCELLGGGLLNGRTSGEIPGTIYMKTVAAKDEKAGRVVRGRQETRKWVAGVSVAASLLLVGGAVAAYVLIRSRRRAKARPSGVPAMIEWFTYAQLQAGTRNFSDRLGSGGFGVVYKGSLPAGDGCSDARSAIAVKQLLPAVHHQGEKQFRMEVATIGSIQHVNLVRLRGFCTEKSHRLLVYDFMANGSLDAYLISTRTPPPTPNSPPARPILDWATRFRIALDTARGIAYLHDGCRQCIIHCDIKPENILLDADFSAKVADFGMAKFMGREFSRALTTIRGTRGYLAPEWIAGMPITPKADVYSFGMTILELVSGRRNAEHTPEGSAADSSGSNATVDSAATSELADPHRRFFPVWAALCIQEGRDLTGLVDRRLRGIVDHEQLRRIVFTAVWCIQDHEISRPTMRHVVHILEGSVDVGLPPMPESLRVLVLEEDPWPTNNSTPPICSPSPPPL